MKDQTHLMSQPKGDDTWMEKTGGFAKDMTLRDWYAGLAMQGMLSNEKLHKQILEAGQSWIEESAWMVSEAMLKEREK
jgi:hypothetical protein